MKKVLLKISGEALKGNKEFGFDEEMLSKVANMIKEVKQMGVSLAIVVGGGNIYRGSGLISAGVNPSDSHNLSMLSTVFNGVVLKNFLEKIGLNAIVMDPNGIKFTIAYNKDLAKSYLEQGIITIFTGGTGNPYFSTDTGGVLRALELGADFMLKATRVDGVYDSDPEKNPDAKFFDTISYHEVLTKELKVMDLSAIDIAKNNSLEIRVANLFKPGVITKVISGEKEGSIIK